MTFFEWVDAKLPTDRAVMQFIYDYNNINGVAFDKKYSDVPEFPQCKCYESCMCFEFDVMRHALERTSNG